MYKYYSQTCKLALKVKYYFSDTTEFSSFKVSFNINKKFPKDSLEKGQFNDIDRKIDNYFKTSYPLVCNFTNSSIDLNVGDKVYYWMGAADLRLCRFLKEDQSFTVGKDENGNLIAKNTTLEDFQNSEEDY